MAPRSARIDPRNPRAAHRGSRRCCVARTGSSTTSRSPGRSHAVFARSEHAHGVLRRRSHRRRRRHGRCRRRVHRPTRSASPRTTASSRSTPTSSARPSPATACGSSASRSPSSSPTRSRAARSMRPPLVWADYAPLRSARRPPRRARIRRRPALPRTRFERGDRRRRPPRRGVPAARRRRRRGSRPLRQPAHGGRADGAQRLRRRPEADGRLTFYASTQMPHGLAGQLADALGIDAARGAGHHARRSAAASAARPASAPSTRRCAAAATTLGRPVAWIADAERGPGVAAAQPRPGPVRRAGAARATARSWRCGCASSATPAPTRASVPSSRCSRSGCRTARTGSTRSSSTSRRRHEHARRRARTAAPAVPRRPPCSSGSSTRPRSSWASTRSSCAAATSSPTTPSRSRRSPGAPTTAARYATPLDVAAEAIGYDELREPSSGDGASAATGCSSESASPSYVEITAGGGRPSSARVEVHDDGSATVRAGRRPRSGPPDGVRDDRERSHRHPGRPDHARRRRHRPRPARRRHGWVAVAADRRLGRRRRDGHARRPSAQAARRVDRSRPTSPTSSSTLRPARSAWPGSRPSPCRGPSSPQAADGAGGRRSPPRSVRPGRARRSRSAPTSPPSRSTSTPGRSRCSATSPSTTAAPCSTRCSSRASSTAASRPDRPGAVRGDPLRRRRQPADGQPGRLRHPDRRRAAELRRPVDRDADAAQPARRQGHRRGRDHRGDPGRAERGDRRARPPRRAPHRPAVHAGAGVADDP